MLGATRNTDIRRVAFLLALPYSRSPGGGERYVSELARALRSHVEVTEHYMDPGRVIQASRYVRSHRTYSPPGRHGYRFAVSPGALAAARAADIVHVHQYGTLTSVAVAALSRLTRRPVFVTDHGSSGLAIGHRLGVDRLFTQHLCVSEFALSQIPSHRGTVIYGGVRERDFRPAPRSDAPFALYVGRLVRHKGVDWLIRSIPEGMRLVVAGRPNDVSSPGYLPLLRDLARGRDVTFILSPTDGEIVRLYQSAWAAVLPSLQFDTTGRRLRVPELLGLTLLEAMACGTPTVASRVGALSEVVTAESGFLVEPGDEVALRSVLSHLLGDRPLVERLGAGGRARVEEKFTWAKVADRCLAAYRGAPV